MAKPKDRIWNLKATNEFIERLRRASEATDRPAAQIAREAINEKLDELAERFPEINAPVEKDQPIAA